MAWSRVERDALNQSLVSQMTSVTGAQFDGVARLAKVSLAHDAKRADVTPPGCALVVFTSAI
jgi:hypothetical protein